MSRLTGNEVKNLMEAYAEVYAPQELTEEQIWEEVENWVNSLLEEGYDLSEYTWEEMYESYIEETAGQRFGAGVRDVIGSNWRGLTGRQTTSTNPASRATNLVGRVVSAPVRAGINYTGAVMQGYGGQRTTSQNPVSRAGNAVTRNIGGFVRGLVTGNSGATNTPAAPARTPATATTTPAAPARPSGSPTGGARPAAPARPSGSPTPTGGARPATAAAAPSRPAAPAATQTGDKTKDMATWAKANPKLADAAAERSRIRGTQQTDNPLMKDMKSRLPMNSPSVQAPAVAKLGAGNQSLSQNPNAFKAATTPQATTAASSTSPSASTGPTLSPSNVAKQAAAPKPITVRPGGAGSNKPWMREEYDAYDLVLEYLLSQGHVETLEEALYVMMEMTSETIQDICEAKYATKKGAKEEKKTEKEW